MSLVTSPPVIRSPLSKRPLNVSLYVPTASTLSSASTPSPLHSRHLKRIHVAAEILKAAKICAGDVLILRLMASLEEQVEELQVAEERVHMFSSGKDIELRANDNADQAFLQQATRTSRKEGTFAIGIAWPSFTLSGTGESHHPICFQSRLFLISSILCCRSHCCLASTPCERRTGYRSYWIAIDACYVWNRDPRS